MKNKRQTQSPEQLKKYPYKDYKKAIGRKEYIDYRDGKSLQMKSGIIAKCYDCMGHYADGKVDCGCTECPLHPWMPYKGRTSDPDIDGESDNE